jgi:hypothetical protein
VTGHPSPVTLVSGYFFYFLEVLSELELLQELKLRQDFLSVTLEDDG